MNEKRIYICTIDWLVFNEVFKYNIWGVKDRAINQISKINIGDILIFYIKSGKYRNEKIKSSIYGIFEVSGNMDDLKGTFKDQDLLNGYPNKLIFKEFIEIKEPKIFKPLVEKLSFVKSKQKWGITFMGKSAFEINKSDYKIIEEYLK